MDNKKGVADIAYLELIKKAFSITWNNRYLWWLGIFLALSQSFQMLNFRGEESQQGDLENYWNFVSSNLSWIIPLSIVIVILMITLLILGTWSRIGIIDSADKITREEPSDFRKAWKKGRKLFWKVVLLGIILSLSLGIILSVMIVPIILLFVNHSYIAGGILAFIALLILIPVMIIFAFLRIYGEMYLILGKISVIDSLESAYSLFRKNIWTSIVMGLLFIPLGIFLGIAIITLVIALTIIFGIVALIFFLILKWTGVIIIASIGGLVFIALFLAINSFYQAFAQVLWVLFWKEIASPKAEEILEEVAKETNIEAGEVKPGVTTSEIE